jgi:hypothetical protein
MSIFVQPRNGDSFGRVVRRAVQILRAADILSAHAGTLNEYPVLLIDRCDMLEALAILEQAGLRAAANWKYLSVGISQIGHGRSYDCNSRTVRGIPDGSPLSPDFS